MQKVLPSIVFSFSFSSSSIGGRDRRTLEAIGRLGSHLHIAVNENMLSEKVYKGEKLSETA